MNTPTTPGTLVANDEKGKIGKDETPKMLGAVGTWAAGILIIVWLIAIVVLWNHVDDADARWARLLLIFNSIETVAFAAVSALLGVQVKRAQVAEKGEKEAKKEVVQEKKVSQIGDRLASTVLAEKDFAPVPRQARSQFWQEKTGTSASVQLAQELLDARHAQLEP